MMSKLKKVRVNISLAKLAKGLAKGLSPKSPEPKYGAPGSPVTGHIRFRLDKMDHSKTFLELDGQRIRFLKLKIDSYSSRELPTVIISVYARLIEGEIVGAKGAIEIIHIDESTKGKDYAPQADDLGGCPAGIKLDD
jgi:hypothetical protein